MTLRAMFLLIISSTSAGTCGAPIATTSRSSGSESSARRDTQRDAADVPPSFAHNDHTFRIVSGLQNIFQNDAPEIPSCGGNARNPDAAGMQQAVYPGGGTSGRKAARQGKAAHAVQGHHQIVGEGEGIDFQLVDHEGGIRIAGRKIIAHPDEGQSTR